MERTSAGIRVTYFYSACVGIATPDATILCDPWFTDGIYDGAWYQYPKLEDPLETIGAVDVIWVSHIHPDHYDPRFLREYLERYPETRVVIGPFEPNYLGFCMQSDGIPFETAATVELGETRMGIFLNDPPGGIDSALIVRHGDHAVANINDNVLRQGQLEAMRGFADKIDIALLPYTGAGPYPQTYVDDPEVLATSADSKKHQFFERYEAWRAALEPRVSIPFAGKYVLGGKLHDLNRWRGVADAVEVTRIDPNAVVLADGGKASIDTVTFEATEVRSQPYDPEEEQGYVESLADRPMAYERYFDGLPLDAIPFRRLLPKAYRNAIGRSSCDQDWFLCIQLEDGWFAFNTRRDSDEWHFVDSVDHLPQRSEITIDARYLYGLLTSVFHWNNAEVGSQYRTRRVPDRHDRDVQGFLNYFHV